MPIGALLPILLGIGGSAAGALAGSAGKKQSSTSTSSGNQSQSVDMLRQAIEPEYFDSFRQFLIPLLSGELNRAMTKPIYGDAEKSKFMGELNDLTSSAMQSLKGNLAGVGALDSGRAATMASELGQQRLAQASNFFRDLPFQEEQARAGRVQPLLSMATNWAGRAPVSEKQTGTTNSNFNQSGDSSTTLDGTPWWAGFANNLSGLAGGMLGQITSNMGNWGKKSTPTPTLTPPSSGWGSEDWNW